MRALTQFTTMHGWADLIEITAAQAFQSTGSHQTPLHMNRVRSRLDACPRRTLLIRQKGSVCSAVISQSSDTTPICFQMTRCSPFEMSLSINTCLNASEECSSRRGLNQADQFDETVSKTRVSEAYKCVADGKCVSARFIRIYKTGIWPSDIINLQELVTWSSAFPDVNLAAGKVVTCTPACSSSGQNVVDGSSNIDCSHLL